MKRVLSQEATAMMKLMMLLSGLMILAKEALVLSVVELAVAAWKLMGLLLSKNLMNAVSTRRMENLENLLLDETNKINKKDKSFVQLLERVINNILYAAHLPKNPALLTLDV